MSRSQTTQFQKEPGNADRSEPHESSVASAYLRPTTTGFNASEITVWVVSELYAPELTSTGYYLTEIAEHLARIFPHVTAIVSQPTYAARGTRAAAFEKRNGVTVRRFWNPALAKDALIGRACNLLAYSIHAGVALLWSVRSGDVVLAVTNPPPMPYIAALICRIKRARLVLLVHDVYPEVLVASGLAASDSGLVRIAHTASKWLYRRSDKIIVLGRDMSRLIRRKLSTDGAAAKLEIIPNWANLDAVQMSPVTEQQLANPMTVQYAGNMGRGHNIEILVEASARLPEINFAFIGHGAKRPWLERTIEERGLHNVAVRDYRPRGEMSESLADCDLSVISFVSGMSGVSVPSRLYNVLAAGRPILAICDADSELALVVEEERLGWVVRPNDVDGLVAVLRQAATHRTDLFALGARAYDAAQRRFSRACVMQSYEELFRRMVSA